jgi:hypothetical protein
MIKQSANPLQSAVAGLGLLAISTLAAHALDTSSIVSVSGAYNARDVVTSQNVSGGFSVVDGQVHTWLNDWNGYVGYQVSDIATGLVNTIGHPSFPINSNGYGDAFGLYDKSTGSFYAGTYNDAGSGLYRYDTASGNWASLGVFNSLYGAASHNGQVYASGLNAIWTGGVGQGNQIALYDLTGAGSHDVLIQATGNSAFVALDNAGNIYYANYNGGSPGLYKWSFDDINLVRADQGGGSSGGGEDDLYLRYEDAQLLTNLPGGANGIAVDDGGNVFVTVNGSSSALVMWNESMGAWSEEDPFHFQQIAGSEGSFGWFGALDTQGDFLNGGSVYLSNYGSNGLAEITMAVPEPSTYALLIISMGGLYLWRRNRNARA